MLHPFIFSFNRTVYIWWRIKTIVFHYAVSSNILVTPLSLCNIVNKKNMIRISCYLLSLRYKYSHKYIPITLCSSLTSRMTEHFQSRAKQEVSPKNKSSMYIFYSSPILLSARIIVGLWGQKFFLCVHFLSKTILKVNRTLRRNLTKKIIICSKRSSVCRL
jgi:hypothetical protein